MNSLYHQVCTQEAAAWGVGWGGGRAPLPILPPPPLSYNSLRLSSFSAVTIKLISSFRKAAGEGKSVTVALPAISPEVKGGKTLGASRPFHLPIPFLEVISIPGWARRGRRPWGCDLGCMSTSCSFSWFNAHAIHWGSGTFFSLSTTPSSYPHD